MLKGGKCVIGLGFTTRLLFRRVGIRLRAMKLLGAVGVGREALGQGRVTGEAQSLAREKSFGRRNRCRGRCAYISAITRDL